MKICKFYNAENCKCKLIEQGKTNASIVYINPKDICYADPNCKEDYTKDGFICSEYKDIN